MKKSRGYFNSTSDRIIMGGVNVVLFMALIVIVIPLIHIISSSLSNPSAVANGKVFLWPVNFYLEGYAVIFKTERVVRGFTNTIFYTVVGTCINLLFTILAAYPLSRRDIKGRNFIMFLLTFTMIFHGGLIPTYMVVKSVGILNTRWALLLPNALAVWNVIITRTYFQTSIPESLYESASLEGCRDSRYVISIVLPLSKPIIAVMILLYSVYHWNSYFDAFLYLRNLELFPLQLVLRDILISGGSVADPSDVMAQMDREYMQNLLKYSLIVVSSLPVMMLYPFIQKYFIKGIMVGAIKG
jgi:putative aldouronate transport system permease protein